MSIYLGARQRLGHQVRWVFRAKDLKEAARFGPHKVLCPKLCDGWVAHLADTASVANADCCGRIRVNLGPQLDAEVTRYALEP